MSTKSPKQLIANVQDAVRYELEQYKGPSSAGDLAELLGTACTLAIAEFTTLKQMRPFKNAKMIGKTGKPVEVYTRFSTGFLALVKGKHFDAKGLFIPTFIVRQISV